MPPASSRWMIYGAYGYTGALIAEEAVRRGHRPVLAGRSKEKLAPIADRLGLPSVAVDLDDRAVLAGALEDIAVVVHAAGPFVRTSRPMIDACLDAGASYLDITGEIPVFQATLGRDVAARERGVVLISGVGFDVVPTDCLALTVSERLPGATALELAIASTGRSSAGTARTALEMLPRGNFVRRGGVLVERPLGRGARVIRFSVGKRTVLPIPWGDLETAFHTTAIPDITTYLAIPPQTARVFGLVGPLLKMALSLGPVLRYAQWRIDRKIQGPDAAMRERARSYVWARAAAPDGREAQAWLETVEGYRFTAEASVRSVERVLADRPVGALTPARAFGADFVLDIEGTRRFDSLPG